LHNKKELDERMEEAGVQPLKKLGQNFLLNPKICQVLVDAALKFKPVTVVEIGPGLGAITDDLGVGEHKLVLVEADAGLVKYWQGKLPRAEILHQDALRIDWNELSFSKPAVLVSNLPYSIAASLVVELSGTASNPFFALVLMFQKEVAERIQAEIHGEDYGMLSVIAQASWNIDRVIDAGPQDFFPVPHVGSRVLSFTPKTDINFDREKFLKFVKLAFSQRRKKLSSNLQGGYDKAKLKEVFASEKLGDDTRAQELSPPQFINLFKALSST